MKQAVLTLLTVLPTVVFCQLSCGRSTSTPQTQECLLAIKSAANDRTRFWFGESFMSTCLEESTPLIDCIVSFPPNPAGYSLVDFLFPEDSNALDGISQLLTVTYHSPPGEFDACSHHYVVEDELTFTLDPSSNQSYGSWNARNIPEVTWDSKDGVQYTLFIIDAAIGILHGAYMNINGNDVANAVILKLYHGPRNVRSGPGNVYAFVLYEQNAVDMERKEEWLEWIYSSNSFNLSAFISPDAMNLTGPVAVNWLLASGDAYGVGQAWLRGFAMNCVPFIEQAYDDMDPSFSFMPRNMVKLEMFVEMSFDVPASSYYACCREESFPQETIKLDPIGSKAIAPVQTRTGVPFNIRLIPNTFFFNQLFNFTGRSFSVLVIDPDVSDPSVGNPDRPFLHGLYVNLDAPFGNANMTSGRAVVDYFGPMPPDHDPHRYLILILEQPSTLEVNSSKDYVAQNCSRRQESCLFDVVKFMTENNLGLVGMTWFTSQNDDWVKLQNGENETVFCAGREDYSDPCTTDGSPQLLCLPALIMSMLYLITASFVF